MTEEKPGIKTITCRSNTTIQLKVWIPGLYVSAYDGSIVRLYMRTERQHSTTVIIDYSAGIIGNYSCKMLSFGCYKQSVDILIASRNAYM